METAHETEAAAPAPVARAVGDGEGQTVLQITVDRGVGTPPKLCGECKWWMEVAKPFTKPGDRCPTAGEAGLRCPACVEAEKALTTRSLVGLEKVREALASLQTSHVHSSPTLIGRCIDEAEALLSEFLAANGGE